MTSKNRHLPSTYTYRNIEEYGSSTNIVLSMAYAKHAKDVNLVEINLSCHYSKTFINQVTKHHKIHHLAYKVKLPYFSIYSHIQQEIHLLYGPSYQKLSYDSPR